MENLSRFLERNAHRFGTGKAVLFFNPPGGTLLDRSDSGIGPVAIFCQDFASWQAFHSRDLPADFGVFPTIPPQGWASIVLCLPRERALREAMFRWCGTALATGGTLWVAGENRAGIKSSSTALRALFGDVDKQDSARHCVLYRARVPLFCERFDEADLLEEWTFRVNERDYRAFSTPGVFAHGHLDPASRLLLETLEPMQFSGRALDFGCGAGVLSAVLGSRNSVLELTLIDSNALALASARRTLSANNVQGDVIASDGLGSVAGPYDLVISNPPFHQGIHTKSGMSMAMLDPIRNFLSSRGQLILVANRHLAYGDWMNRVFGNHRVMAADRQYQVLQSSIHKSPDGKRRT